MDANNEHFGEELQRLARQKGLRKLRGELDFDDWGFAAQAKLGKRNVWHVVATPRPDRREVQVPAEERGS